MPGVAGSGGPVPKRSDQRRRQNKPTVPVTKAAAGSVIVIPEADPDWHPIMRRWYESLGTSGQRVFYQDADWLTAWAAAEAMSREFLKDGPVSAGVFGMFLKACTALLATEGDRRRARLELEREEAPEEVTSIDRYRRRLGSTG